MLTLFLLFLSVSPAFAISQQQLEQSIHKAETYYEGLYQPIGNNMAVVNEYYTGTNQDYYTIRHGVTGGIYYYMQTGQFDKAQKLTNFALTYGVNPNDDLHSYIWKGADSGTENLYSTQPYYDCTITMPQIGGELPYHSKVCKFGNIGLTAYIAITKTDPLVITIQQLQNLESGKSVDKQAVLGIQTDYNKVGNGVPMCIGSFCSKDASTIRTAEFGDLQLRLGDIQSATTIVENIIKAQNTDGSVNISYDKQNHLVDNKNGLYTLLDDFFEDRPILKGIIPSNAETLNDVLAFLLQYECKVFKKCNQRI